MTAPIAQPFTDEQRRSIWEYRQGYPPPGELSERVRRQRAPDAAERERNPWGISFGTMFAMDKDSDLFMETDDLTALGYQPGRTEFGTVAMGRPDAPDELYCTIDPGSGDDARVVDLIGVRGVQSIRGRQMADGEWDLTILDAHDQPVSVAVARAVERRIHDLERHLERQQVQRAQLSLFGEDAA